MTILTGMRLMRKLQKDCFCVWPLSINHYENLDRLKCAEFPLERQVQRKNSKVQNPGISRLKEQLV